MNRHSTCAAVAVALLFGAVMAFAWPPDRTSAAATIVNVTDNQFVAPNITNTAGDTVTWNWTGANPHSVTADDSSFDDPAGSSKTSGTFSQIFNTAGTFAYYCRIHGGPGVGMHGTIVVQAAAATSTPTSTPTALAATDTPGPTHTAASGTNTPPAATNTPTALNTPAPTATAAVAPVVAVTDAASPSSPVASGASPQLPRTGAGAGKANGRARWSSLVLAAAGVVAMLGAVAVGKRS